MARGIILRNNGINQLNDSPTGYKYIGYDGESFSEKSGATVSVVGGSSLPYTIIVGYLRLDVPFTDDTTITFYELENTTPGTITVTRIISGLYQIFTDDTNGFTINKVVAKVDGIIENSTDSVNLMSNNNSNYIRIEYRDSAGSFKSIGSAFVQVEIKIYN